MNMLKKIFIGIVIIILLVIFIPLIVGMANDAEVFELNNDTREGLYGEFIRLSDGWTHYEMKRTGEIGTIVLIHGNSSPYFSFDNNVAVLSEAGFRVLRYDIYGHGFSDRPEVDFDHFLHDRQLGELLDTLDIRGPVDLMGTSQGGSIAVYFTAHHPERVRKLALLAPLMDEFTGMNSLDLIKTPVEDYFKTAFFDNMNLKSSADVFVFVEKLDGFQEKYRLQMQYKGWKRAKLSNMRKIDLETITRAFKTVGEQDRQVLLIWGELDKLIPEESVRRMVKVLANSEFRMIAGAGHIAHYEFPEVVNPILVEFFQLNYRR